MSRNEMTNRFNRAWAWAKKPTAGMPRWGWSAAIATVVFIVPFWFWLRMGGGSETYGDTLRNLILILAGPVGLGLATWRNRVADKQANAAQIQVIVAQRGLQNERYQKGADMLGSDTLTTRIGGIYALERLAQDHPKKYHTQIMDVLCTFIRYPKIIPSNTESETKTLKNENFLVPDIHKALAVIGRRSQKQRDLEKTEKWHIDLPEARLDHAILQGAHLEGANLQNAHMKHANLWNAYLESANLMRAHLENANLMRAHLEKANLMRAHPERTFLWSARLEDARLQGVHLEGARLRSAHLEGARLRGAHLEGARLEGAHLEGARLRGAHLEDARLEGAHLEGVEGLTQAMLDSAAHFDGKGELLPGPNLEGAFCAESGKPLVWRTPPNSSSTSDSGETNSSLT